MVDDATSPLGELSQNHPRMESKAAHKHTRRETLYLAECARDKGQPLRQTVAVADAAAFGAVEADRMHLVNVGHCAVSAQHAAKRRTED
jgi:hypothetical protein